MDFKVLEHFLIAIIGMICILICVYMNHTEAASSIAFICVGASGARSAQDIMINRSQNSPYNRPPSTPNITE
jgi:hypothetical protein